MFEIGLYPVKKIKGYDYLKACIYMLQQMNTLYLKKQINQTDCYLTSYRQNNC